MEFGVSADKRSFQLNLAGVAADPRTARVELRRCLGLSMSAQFLDDAELLTSELVTNAVVHVGRAFSVQGSCDGTTLRVEVSDLLDTLVALVPVGEERTIGGRGLRIVENLASRWGTDLSPPGKTVWFELLALSEPPAVQQ